MGAFNGTYQPAETLGGLAVAVFQYHPSDRLTPRVVSGGGGGGGGTANTAVEREYAWAKRGKGQRGGVVLFVCFGSQKRVVCYFYCFKGGENLAAFG